jgi:hypothetical protein
VCFSATASFTAAAVLLPAGGLSLYRAWCGDRRYLALGALPLLFGVQQLFDGLVWRAGDVGDADAVTRFSLAYMFFSWLAWPIWVPVATYFAHHGWLVTRFLPHAISYGGTQLLDFVIGRVGTYSLYLSVIIVPLLLSTQRDVKIFGVLVAFVVVVTYTFFQYAYVSVFCFGGAIMSLYLVWRPFSTSGRGANPQPALDFSSQPSV